MSAHIGQEPGDKTNFTVEILAVCEKHGLPATLRDAIAFEEKLQAKKDFKLR